MRTKSIRCLDRLLLALAFTTLIYATAGAQGPTPGQNINMVSGTTFPGGDPFLQRQNEPSIAVSTRNPLHLLAGANDYRTVDLPLTDQLSPELAGNAWLGMFKSFDGGATWRSTLLPGFPQDQSSFGLSSPLKGQTTASDAVVRAGPNGLFFYSGIASNPNTKQGVVFVARFIDLNNKENGNIVQNGDPIKYLGEGVVRTGNTGQFLDKPWLAVGLPGSTTAGTCSIQVSANGTTVTQSFPAPPVYLAWTEFVGNDNMIRTKLYFSRSLDCGVTWGNPTKLSEGYPVNQGSTVGVDPSTGYVYVAWRTFAAASSLDSINIVKSTDGGQTFNKGITVVTLPSYDPNNPTAPTFFDQGTTNTSFRTNAFPAMAIDGSGRIYLAWSQRGIGPNGDARIMMKTSLDGFNWSPAFPVDNGPLTDDKGNMFPRGHQLMPQMTFVGGKLFVLYYDLRLDHTRGFFDTVLTFPAPDTQGRFFLETRPPEGELPGSPGVVFTPFIDDFGLTQRRHTIDVVVAQASPGDMPAFSTARVSQYRFGTLGDGSSTLEQLQVDPPNLPMFRGGTVPFFGDYIDIAGPMSQTMSGLSSATPNTTGTPPTSPVVYATWTSDQDVRPPANGNWTQYTPVGPGGQSIFDPTQSRPACVSGNEGSRNQNIYSSRITQGLAVSSPQNSKPLSASLQREFVIFVQNFTNSDKSFRLTIANQPTGGYASFTPGTNNPGPPPMPPTPPAPVVSMLDVSVAAHSGISRPLFAVSTNTTASITVNVGEITAPMGSLVSGGLSSFVVLNPDPTSPALINPDGAPSGTDIATLEIYNPNISNPNISNPNISNPNISNPNISNPNISNPNISNPNISNPNISNPNISNPNISNPNISNPNISNPNISNTPVSDATYTVTNTGNTSTSYHIKLVKTGNLPGNAQFQLAINKAYSTPVGLNCELRQEDANTLLTNIVNPSFESPANFSDPNISNPNISNATFELAPGETGLVTLRGNNVDVSTMTTIVSTLVAPVVVAQAANTNDPTNTPTVAVPPSTSTFLIFVTQPSNSIVGEAIVPPVQVKAQDNTGAALPSVSITLGIGSQPLPGSGTLSGTTTATTDGTGVATFPGLTVNGNTGTAFTLVASAPNALFVNSIPFSVFAGPVILVNAAPGGVGDEISRGFYLPSYPGTQLRQVRLYFSADTGGAYTLSLSARSSTYGGTLLGTTTSTVTLAANRATFTSADFNFSPIAIAPGSTVTFAIGLVSAPAGAVAGQPFYDTGPCSAFLGDMACSVSPNVIETEGTTLPLDTFRRGSVAVRILGLP